MRSVRPGGGLRVDGDKRWDWGKALEKSGWSIAVWGLWYVRALFGELSLKVFLLE